MQLDSDQVKAFQQLIWDFYKKYGRVFAWRFASDPYYIFVSEVMLQQTQTNRVEKKYAEFVTVFPTLDSLARASVRDLLTVWQGLGYNRRALYLHTSAQKIMQDYGGSIPDNPDILVTLPGIGKATAASICAFAFNIPTVFIETNIRTVFIDSFFKEQETIHDQQILSLVAATLDKNNSREWYYALMDYGVYLKKTYPNPSKKSAHYAVQSKFEGSDRQIRGMIIRLLTERERLTIEQIVQMTQKKFDKVELVIQTLIQDRLIKQENDYISII